MSSGTNWIEKDDIPFVLRVILLTNSSPQQFFRSEWLCFIFLFCSFDAVAPSCGWIVYNYYELCLCTSLPFLLDVFICLYELIFMFFLHCCVLFSCYIILLLLSLLRGVEVLLTASKVSCVSRGWAGCSVIVRLLVLRLSRLHVEVPLSKTLNHKVLLMRSGHLDRSLFKEWMCVWTDECDKCC